jgi:hypothetical protein
VKRNRVPVAAAALLLLSLCGGLAATLWEAHIARVERAKAERRFNDVREVANSLMFEIHDSIKDLPGARRPRESCLSNAPCDTWTTCPERRAVMPRCSRCALKSMTGTFPAEIGRRETPHFGVDDWKKCVDGALLAC